MQRNDISSRQEPTEFDPATTRQPDADQASAGLPAPGNSPFREDQKIATKPDTLHGKNDGIPKVAIFFVFRYADRRSPGHRCREASPSPGTSVVGSKADSPSRRPSSSRSRSA